MGTMKNIEQIKEELWWKENYQRIMIIALRAYEWSKNKKFYEKAKYFGEQSKQCGQRIADLS
jgi:hypothetical protein